MQFKIDRIAWLEKPKNRKSSRRHWEATRSFYLATNCTNVFLTESGSDLTAGRGHLLSQNRSMMWTKSIKTALFAG